MGTHVDEYFKERTLWCLKNALEIISGSTYPLENADLLHQETQALVSYMKQHGDDYIKGIIQEIWD